MASKLTQYFGRTGGIFRHYRLYIVECRYSFSFEVSAEYESIKKATRLRVANTFMIYLKFNLH